MKKITYYSLILVSLFALNACERVIDLDLPKGPALPYIDAWINDQPGVQTIKFLQSTPYMDKQEAAPVTDATINLTDLTTSTVYPFTYQGGAYTFDPGPGNRIGIVNHAYKLSITYKGEEFIATDTLKRVTTIDSITYEFKKESNGEKEGYYAKFHARDAIGGTDYYWIRTYRNNTLNYNVTDMVSIDGSFNENLSDGFLFIPPFQEGITSDEKPYVKGDEVKVMLRSVTKSAYGFLDQAFSQINNGGLFAEVLQNVPANMKNQKAGSSLKIYGWFGTVAETTLSKKIE